MPLKGDDVMQRISVIGLVALAALTIGFASQAMAR